MASGNQTSPHMAGKDVEERELLSPGLNGSRRFSVTHVVVAVDGTLGPLELDAESIYFIVSGRASLSVRKVHADWSTLIEANSAVWIPCAMPHSFHNAGEDPMRILAIRTSLSDHRPGWTELIDWLPAPNNFISPGGYRFFTGQGRTMRDLGSERFTLCGCADIMPGNTLAPHIPLFGAEELMYVVRGEGKIRSGDDDFFVRPGSLVYAPPTTMHSVHNRGQDILRFVFCECIP